MARKKWIQKATAEHKGAATRKAKAEGLTVHEWALKHRHDKGRTGREARLALTLEKIGRRRKAA